MTRIKRGGLKHKRRKAIIKKAKGYSYGRGRKYKAAKNAWIKAKTYAYRDRRTKKRDIRKVWNVKISAAAKALNSNYSRFINSLKKNNIELDRKILADLAEHNPKIFKAIFQEAKK